LRTLNLRRRERLDIATESREVTVQGLKKFYSFFWSRSFYF